MTRVKTLSTLALVTALAITGCKKKDDTGAGASAKPAESAPSKPAEPAAAPAAPAAAPAGGATIASDDDYVAKGIANIEKFTEIFKAAGTDCDKLGDGLTKFQSDNAALFAAMKSYEAAHPDAKKKFDDAAKDKNAAFEAAAGSAMTSCQSNAKVSEALAKLAG